jgi:hypothetical protein
MTASARFTHGNGQLPPNGNKAGHEPDGTPLYVARARLPSGEHPGKYRADWKAASISYGGQEVWVDDYEVWTGRLSDGSTGAWELFRPGMENVAVHVGTEDPLWRLYSARAFHEGGQQLGKWRQDWTAASFPYGGAEIWLTTFEILVPGNQLD